MAITPVSPNNPGAPNAKTTVAENDPAIPGSKTTVAASDPSIPGSKTTVAVSDPSIPGSKTTVAASDPAIPNAKTTTAAANPAVPNAKTTVTANAVARVLCPKLGMDFSSALYSVCGAPKTFDDLFAYSRATTATFINRRLNACGQWEYFLDTDYVGSVTNLAAYSEDFSQSTWAKVNGSISANSGGGYKFIENTAVTIEHRVDSAAIATTNDTFYVDAQYYKNRNVQLRIGNNDGAIFNLESGVIIQTTGSGIPFMYYLGDGIYRCGVTVTAPTATLARIGLTDGTNNTYTGDGESGIILHKAQFTNSLKELPYVKTLATSSSDTFSESLRIEYDPVTGENKGALIEGGSTNLATRSEEFDNVVWSKINSTITTDALMAPDGTMSADKLVPDSGLAGYVSQTTSFVSGSSYTASIYAKSGEVSELRMFATSGWAGSNLQVIFDLSTGTITSSQTDYSDIEYVGNGWYRCSFTQEATATVSSSSQFARVDAALADGTKGLYIWGGQMEEKPFATSYIRTEGSTTSKSRDDLDLKNPSLHPILQSGKELTLESVAAVYSSNTSDVNRAVVGTGATGPRFNLLRVDQGTQAWRYFRSGAADVMPVSVDVTQFNRVVVTISNVDGASLYSNGVLEDTGVGRIPSVSGVPEEMFIGRFSLNSEHLFGHIKEINIYDIELTAYEVTTL